MNGNQDDEASMKVTLRDVFREQQAMKELLQAVAAALPPLTEQLTRYERQADDRFEDHEKRLRALETRVWASIGGFGLLAAAAPYLVRMFG